MKNQLIKAWKEQNIITNKKVLEAFKQVNREDFVRPSQRSGAYIDHPLPIGYGQTISQPTTVMIMTQALDPKKGDNILEIGTGSGYQAALIAKIIDPGKITTTEILPELATIAKNNLKKVGIINAEVIVTDGSCGYKQNSLYDKIIITAASPKIPKPLTDQLKEGGTIIAPVGDRGTQRMIKAIKIKGKLKEQDLGLFVFVPLKGKHGY